MNFSEDFFKLIADEVNEDNILPDILEDLEDEEILEAICELGKGMKNFLGPPQVLFCTDMERGIALFSFEKLLYFHIYGGVAAIAMESCTNGLGHFLADKAPFLGGIGLYGIFKGEEKAFVSRGVTGYCYACLEGFLGFPCDEGDTGFLRKGPYGLDLGRLIGALLSGTSFAEGEEIFECKLPGALPGIFTTYGVM